MDVSVQLRYQITPGGMRHSIKISQESTFRLENTAVQQNVHNGLIDLYLEPPDTTIDTSL